MSHTKNKIAELQIPQISDETDASRRSGSTTGLISAMQSNHHLTFEHGVEHPSAGAIGETISICEQELDPPGLFNMLETGPHHEALYPGSWNDSDEAYLKIQPSHRSDESILSKSSNWPSYPLGPLIPEQMQPDINAHGPNALPEAWCPGGRGYNSIDDTLAPSSVPTYYSYGLANPQSPDVDLGEVDCIL